MLNKKPLHHAFSMTYDQGVVDRIMTPIKIGQSSILEPFSPNKKFMQLNALWDTGATQSVISQKIVDEFKLTPTDMVEIITGNGKARVCTYIVDLILLNNVMIYNLNVLCSNIQDIDAIVGMDVIQTGDFSISNANKKTHFSYCLPSHSNRTCLVEKSDRVNSRKN